MARPTKRTPEREAAIIRALEVGNTRTDASLGAGIDRHTFAAWCQRYPPFLAAVETAEALARQRFVGQVALAARTSWQAAAWVLERRDPENWGRRERLEVAVEARREAERLAGELDGVSAEDLVAAADRIARAPR